MSLRFAVTALAAAVCVLAVAVAVSAQRGSSAASAKDSLFAALAGKNERPKADKDGRGSFAANFEGGQLCYGYVVRNIADPAAAHIHKGSAGKNGDVVITLDTPSSGDPGTVSDCVNVSSTLRKQILRRPATFYVNVHNADFPGGAVRGQLFAKSP
jgi:hypothetical protein